MLRWTRRLDSAASGLRSGHEARVAPEADYQHHRSAYRKSHQSHGCRPRDKQYGKQTRTDPDGALNQSIAGDARHLVGPLQITDGTGSQGQHCRTGSSYGGDGGAAGIDKDQFGDDGSGQRLQQQRRAARIAKPRCGHVAGSRQRCNGRQPKELQPWTRSQ